MRVPLLLAAGAAACSAFAPAVPSGTGLTSLKMAQAAPPAKLPLPKAKVNALEVNKKQWGIEGAPAASAAAPAPKAAPKKAAAKAAAAGSDSSMGFTGVPNDFFRPGQSAFAAEPATQTFLGMRGPRAEGHREKFGGKHAAVSLAMAALLFQPISQAGMYSMEGGSLSKQSFSNLEVPGFGNVKKVPTIESFFPFSKAGFEASPVLFSKNSMVVVEDPRAGCGAMYSDGACHTFLDEMSDLLKKKPETLPRSEGKPLYFTQWSYDHAAWNAKK
ncbi:hypothetical protein GUITHDRAFT_156322 [Guillardia theta CCMP2712]|uniref:Uncharacterized protein n=1 Tax=Guillardia theta (strain CCMP2712) TaxID=905079 RepID=L1I8A6_GUITC|nr:hypothetical protein GUITHDRAFT_156322 [Guillardia theta CCMP2712]EKX32463.1 hypothetical protein GUITHDRAFT_156322 [Guillardia theta CCMP2712]|eukprot:XP_005819443.1 hypothetical protein GUITHDRAFT_156322 [Guillardia theta CCMP2712]